MTISSTTASHQNLQAPPLQQDESSKSLFPKGILDMPTSLVGIITEYLSKITTSDVALVGDLMVNGRENAVYAEQPPVRKWQA